MLNRFPRKSLLKILPTYTVGYTQPLTAFEYKSKIMPLLNDHAGNISNKAGTKIKNAVNWMFYLSEKKKIYSKKESTTFYFYLNFITLTLPTEQKHSDDFVKEFLLQPFIEWMKRSYQNQMYVWKAESQNNGNIHFHITAHTFIHWQSIRRKWNQILAKHKYCKVFQDGTNDKGNAATQIKAAKNPENVGGYLSNYIGKNDRVKLKIRPPKGLPKFCTTFKKSDSQSNYDYSPLSILKRPIEGRLWGCSYNLSRINVTIDEEENDWDTFSDIYEDVLHITEHTKTDKNFMVYCYRNLKMKTVPTNISYSIQHEVNLKAQQKYYTVESLFPVLQN